MSLPNNKNLPISSLVQLFDSTATSYKFLLFKSILNKIENGNSKMSFREIALGAISYAWYSVYYYRLNLGQSDQMGKWIQLLSHEINHPTNTVEVNELIKNSDVISKILSDYKKYVPFRILTPFFADELLGIPDHQKNKHILGLSQNLSLSPLYRLSESDGDLLLSIDANWFDYLSENFSIIEGWWRTKYLEYLQRNNPTVLSLSTKLEPPVKRNMGVIKGLFKEYFEVYPTKRICFYSKTPLMEISHDHFLPWSFLGSDPTYNFVPSEKNINSIKSDKIPDESYIKNLAFFQADFFNFLKEKKTKECESYYQDLKIRDSFQKNDFVNSFADFYIPLFKTAQNQGFTRWKYEQANE